VLAIRVRKAPKRAAVAVVVLLVLGFAFARGFTFILRSQPKRTLGLVRKLFGRVLNPLLLWLSDRFHLDQSVVFHVGRKSGREYATPLCVSPVPCGFVVPAAFGPDVDWLANLRATPEARLVHEGVTYSVQAEVIDADEALRAAGGSPGCLCWQEFRVQDYALLRPIATEPAHSSAPDPSSPVPVV
jgi:deazaflavin-dependent oxidoreductase (nitroreductase family)